MSETPARRGPAAGPDTPSPGSSLATSRDDFMTPRSDFISPSCATRALYWDDGGAGGARGDKAPEEVESVRPGACVCVCVSFLRYPVSVCDAVCLAVCMRMCACEVLCAYATLRM